MADVYEQVKDIIVEEIGVEVEKINLSASIIDDLGADSLDLVELIMKLEEAFDIEVSDEDAEKLNTVGDVVSYIEKLQ